MNKRIKKNLSFLVIVCLLLTFTPTVAIANSTSQINPAAITNITFSDASGNVIPINNESEVVVPEQLTGTTTYLKIEWNGTEVKCKNGTYQNTIDETFKGKANSLGDFYGQNIMGKLNALKAGLTAVTHEFIPCNEGTDGETKTIKIKRSTTLQKLEVTTDGKPVPLNQVFNAVTTDYSITVWDTVKSIQITPTVAGTKGVSYALEVGSQNATSGTPTTVSLENIISGSTISVCVESANKSTDNSVATTYNLTVNKVSAETPIFSAQPVDAGYFINDKTVSALSVSAASNNENNSNLTYRWYKNTVDSNEKGTLIQDATGSSYTPAVDTAGDLYYYCVVTNTVDGQEYTAKSEPALIKVRAVPTVSIEESNGNAVGEEYTYAPGDTAVTLAAKITNAAEDVTLKYQWEAKRISGGSETWSTLTGSTKKTYTPSTNKDSSDTYRLKVTATINGTKSTKILETGGIRINVFITSAGEIPISYGAQSKNYYIGISDSVTKMEIRFVTGYYGLDPDTKTQWYVSTDGQNFEKVGDEGRDALASLAPTVPKEAADYYYYCVCTCKYESASGDEYESTRQSDTVQIRFLNPSISGIEGSGSKSDPFIIDSVDDLVSISNTVRDGNSCSGKYFEIKNTVTTLTLPNNWVPIGTTTVAFEGIFDGNGKLIEIPENGSPLFGRVRNCTVKNLNIHGTKIAGTGLINEYLVDSEQRNIATIENVTLKSGTQTLKSGFIGGYASGINNVVIRNCAVEEDVVIGYNKDQSNIGSFGGDFNGSIINCKSAATVYGVNFVGGIVGSKGQSMGIFEVDGCSFTGTVEATGNYVGGIAGHGYAETQWRNDAPMFNGFATAPNSPYPTIKNCHSSGDVTGKNYVGGILGAEAGVLECWANGIGYVQNNLFTGTVKATDEMSKENPVYVGGVVGYLRSLNRYTNIDNNYCLDTCGAEAIGYINNEYINQPTYGMIHDSVDLSTARFGRSDDPMGADKEKLAKKISTSELAATVALLNSGENSSKQWNNDGTLKYQKHIVRFNVSGVAERYTGGSTLDKNTLTSTVTYSDGSTKDIQMDNVSMAGFDSTTKGYRTLTFTYEESGIKYVTYKEVQITSNAADAGKQYGVSFKLMGDALHGEKGGVHTLSGGGLTTWIPTKNYVIKAGDTVLDVFEKALKDANMIFVNTNGNYISSITNGSVTLAHFDNGPNSGWMYTLNDKHPLLGVAEQVLKDGDRIVFHYTDDYMKEEGSEKWNSGTTEETKTVTTDTASGSTATTTAPTETKVTEKTNADGTKEKTATVTVSTDNQTEIIKQATDKKSTEIVLEVASTATGGAQNVQLQLNVSFVKNVSEKTDAALTVNTENGTVSLDQDTIKTVLSEAKGATITLDVNKVEKPTEVQKKAAGESGQILSLTVKSGDKTISDFKTGKVTVTVAISTALQNKRVAAIHIAEDGKTEQMPGKTREVNGKKCYAFTTSHFSDFALVDADELGLETEDEIDAAALVAKLTPVARSAKTAKGSIKVTTSLDKSDKAIISDLKDAGYTVKYRFYRSTKKSAGYKSATTKKTTSYINTTGKKGTKYFYKVQVRVYDANGKLAAKTALKQCKYASRTK